MSLNPDQQTVVNTTDGEIALIAGPGSGKTSTLVARYKHLVEGLGVPRAAILCVTFTKEAATVMATRAGKGNFSTFHSYGYSLLTAEKGKQPFEPELRHRLLVRLTKQFHVDYKELSNFISRMRHTNMAPDEAEHREPYMMAKAYQRYETERRAAGWIDFDSMICDTVALLERPDVRARHQYRYVMADEMQDCDDVQMRILQLVTEQHKNVLCVGDPGQSIYMFRGAKPENLTEFQQWFPGGKFMYLGTNYRSTQTLANYVRKHYPLSIPLKEKIVAARADVGAQIEYRMFNSELSEAISAVEGANRDPLNSAILARTNRGLAFAESFCRRNNIKYSLLGKSGFFKKPEVVRAMDKLKPYVKLPIASAFAIVLPALEKFYRAEDATKEDNYALENVNTLREIGKDFDSLAEFVDFANKAAHAKRQPKGITLSTVPQANGCEWDNVFTIGARHGMMPHEYGDAGEESRIFLVAISRAKNRLRLSFTGVPGLFLRRDLNDADLIRLQEEASRPIDRTPAQRSMF